MPLIFIPGTGGVTFRRADGERAPFVVELFYGRFLGWTEDLVKELSCEHPEQCQRPWEPTRTTLAGNDEDALDPGEVLLASAYPPIRASRYTTFPYDWRLDIRHNAVRLLEQLRDAGEPASILTHSQGGLVAAAASLLCDDADEWHELVHRVCMVAPPLVGTVNAMDAIINGNNFGNVNNVFFRAASRTWPALFQMFPQWACVANRPAKRSTSESLWPDESEDFHALLARAKEYFAWIDYAPLRHIKPDRLMIVLGNHPQANTAQWVNWSPAGPEVDARRVNGDTLVPYDETVAMLTAAGLRNRIMTVRGAHQPAHFRLLGDARVYKDCDRFLSN